MPRIRRAYQSDVNDPNVWSGRALQEGFVDLADVGQLIVLSTNPSCIKRRWDAVREEA